MLSAGNYPAAYGPPHGYQPPPQQPMGPTFTPAAMQAPPFAMSMPNIALKGNLTPGQQEGMLWANAGGNLVGAAGNIMNSVFNYNLAKMSMESQSAIATKYYEVQDNIAGYQSKVALKQLGVQNNAIAAQQSMHRDQIRHEEQMARLESSMQRQLARIGENGRTERAKIMSTSDAFNRRGWDMGNPALA